MSEQTTAAPQQTNSEDPNQALVNLQTQTWSRVSPLAIVYFFARTLFFLVNNVLLYSLPALAISFSTIKENILLFAAGAAGFLLLILISSVIKYWFYFYKFSAGRVEIKQGVFQKSHLDLPFKKIQNVKIVQPFYYRFNQYSFIELDTAGSAQQEAKIVALPLKLAESFKDLILQIKQVEQSQAQESSILESGEQQQQTVEQEILLNERSLKDLVIHGISNNRVWIFLGFLAPFYGSIGENLSSFLEAIGLDLASYLDYQSQSLGLFILHVLSLVMLIMLVIVSFSVIGSIFVFYGYKLSRQGDRYIRRSGLMTKHEVSMRLSRVQIAVQQQDWLDVIIKRVNLRFEQNSSLPSAAGQAGNINNASKLIVPSVTPQESITLIQDTFPVKDFSDITYLPISKRFLIRFSIMPMMPILLILCTMGFALEFSLLGWSMLGLFTVLLGAMGLLRWKRWGYYFGDDNHVYIRKGFIGVNYYVFPIGKMQQIKVKQSIFMRRHKLADISYVLACGGYRVPLIPVDSAQSQADNALLFVEKLKPNWM
ncbi:PH domain-containing protein [Glaciecola petra]|uniref:PH domain-containing protein n=1 Tax=Glaciecola petra TaxID=3075602 RepID=A0ABU2ZWH5_9ALTE|nr:PH domain-containing protein [Aestuariibacter sp. P117]MDT0596664.1 PH domain-containing protein [Aestuariibacter sp. P117]